LAQGVVRSKPGRRRMQHLRVGVYVLSGGTTGEVIERVQSAGGMLEVFREQPGFVAYGVATTEDEFLISLSIWDSAAQADAATAVAAEWVAEHLADRVELQDDFVGDLAFLAQANLRAAG
jgi:heme-degrading monooxygenase HmoA